MHSGIVLISDPRVVAIDVRESAEPMVDLTSIPRLRIDPRKADASGGWHHARAGLAERLGAAAAALPSGIDLLIVEAFRSPDAQRRYWNGYRADLLGHYPGLSERRLYQLASRWVAPPEVAPHCTGGAVDLTLCDEDGVELDLGSELDATPEESSGACFTAAAVPREASAHRSVLVQALTAAGLVNYPTEWWHWSYGERYWAFTTGVEHARYGPAELPRR
ncbi:MAG: M15 family metallopeptidase [Micropruina sp.]|uniref:M15 family metallopeptidase n=1 Tax=Micropruina sp. TaxID=2737536 RepID=UPI0039E66670